MGLIEFLTPKDTEEVRPGLFVKTTLKGYRVMSPLAWNGKLRVKEQLKTVFSLRTIFTIALVLFIAYSYIHDNSALLDFYKDVRGNPQYFCANVEKYFNGANCTQLDRVNGLCMNGEINISSFKLADESSGSLS